MEINNIIDFFNSPMFGHILNIIVLPVLGFVLRQGKKIINGYKLLDMKINSIVGASQKVQANGFEEEYNKLLNAQIRDNRFKLKGE